MAYRAFQYALFVVAIFTLACDGCSDTGREPNEEPVCDGGDCIDLGDDLPNMPDAGACPDGDCDCVFDARGGVCRAEYCILTVEPDEVVDETRFELTAMRVSAPVGEELLGSRACSVAAAQPEPLFTLAIEFEEADLPDGFEPAEVVAVRLDPEPTLTQAVLDEERSRVMVTGSDALVIGAAVLPASPSLNNEFGVDLFEVEDAATYLRNLSRWTFAATFHDGQRFYVANGPRVLIWSNGIPLDPTTPPDIVLGRPGLSTDTNYASASSFKGSVNGLWSDGTRLAVSESSRVLIWNQVPTADFAPADIVLGQDNFVSYRPNREGPATDDTFSSPDEIWSDGARFLVADTQNHRFLVWNEFPTTTGQPADLVFGQEDFNDNGAGGGSLQSYQARSAFWDGSRLVLSSTYAASGVFVYEGFPAVSNPSPNYALGLSNVLASVSESVFLRPDSVTGFGDGGLILGNNWRASVWRMFPTENQPSDFTIGKPDGVLGGIVGRVSAASFSHIAPQSHVFSRLDDLVIADGYRLLIWNSLPTHDFVPADLVIGQPSAATSQKEVDYRGLDEETVSEAASVSAFGDVVVVADRGNSRVLVVKGSLQNPESIVVLGQPDATSFGPNHMWSEISASTLSDPTGVYTDGKSILVADSGNHRVLIWTSIPATDGKPADLVLGQVDFQSGEPNGGAGDADGDGDSDATVDTFHYPSGVWADADRILVADTYNHRVLVFTGSQAGSTPMLTGVLGQADYVANDVNRGLGWFTRAANTLAAPTAVVGLENSGLAVADSENSRVVTFDAAFAPQVVLGQPDLVSNASSNHLGGANIGFPLAEHQKSATAASLRTPFGLASTDGWLYVADTGNHRALGYQFPLTSGMDATAVFGQPDFTMRSANDGGVGAGSAARPEGVTVDLDGGVLVADTGNHRVLKYSAGVVADDVFGQTIFSRNGHNRAALAFATVEGPGAVFVDGTKVWVADSDNHRVVAYVGGNQLYAIGQPDFGVNQPNAGRAAPTGATLAKPSDVWTDGTRFVVADRDNHRVLIWNEVPLALSIPADLVLGQSDFISNAPNQRGGPTAATLLAPEAVWVDGETLFVADTGNNRVLRWDTFPAANGGEADAVLCQARTDRNASNQGAATPTGASCAGPADLLVIGDSLWVADTLNHRVLRWSTDFADGAEASQVLGQPDLQTRIPRNADLGLDGATFNSPSGLAFDGRTLFIADSGNHRVLIYDELPQTSSLPADRLIGQSSFEVALIRPERDGLESPRGIFVLPGANHSSTLWVADSGKDRIVSFDRVARLF